jgi:hypothetical protein
LAAESRRLCGLRGSSGARPFVELEYKAPLFTFSRGSLGPPPQRYNGVAATIAIVVAVLILFVPWFLMLALL